MTLSNLGIAWDPGVTTGICVFELDPTDPEGFRVLQSAVMAWKVRFEVVPHLLREIQPGHLIVEKFILYKHKARDQIGSDFPSAQLMGTIEMAARFVLLTPPQISRPPASVMERVEILSRDVSQIVASEHARDAYKHARFYATQLMTRVGALV